MEKQERNLAIETIVKIVNNKYPNYQSQDTEKAFKLNAFKNALSPKNKLKAFNFVDYSISYIVRNEKIVPQTFFADDILNIAKIFDKPASELAELSLESLDNYVKLIRNEGYAVMTILNKVMLNKDILDNIYYSRVCFTNEKDYINYKNLKFSQILSHYYCLKTKVKDENAILEQIQSEINKDFEKLFSSYQNSNIDVKGTAKDEKSMPQTKGHTLKLKCAANSQISEKV